MTEQQDKNNVSNKVYGLSIRKYSITLATKNQERSRTSAHKGYPVPMRMKNSKLKEYLNGFSDDADISLIVANTQNRKVYEPKEVIVMTDVEIPAFVIDVCNERDMDAEEISVCEECERNTDDLEGQMDISDFPEVMP